MKKTLLLFLIICASNAYGQVKSYDYCYSNNKGTCVYSVPDKTEIVVVRGVSDPCISPDGTKLAYTYNTKDGGRGIKVIDINSKKKTILNTHSDNCYGAVWSPNGKYIAYNVFNVEKSDWGIAVIDTNNTEPMLLTAKLEQSYMPTWTADSKNVVVQNMESVFVFNLSGNLLNTFKIPEVNKEAGTSSDDRFIFTDDGKKIVFSNSVDEPGFKEGPSVAVFVYDIAAKSTKRLSPKGYFASNIVVNKGRVLFTGDKFKSKTPNIYTVALDGSNFKILFTNCSDISAKK